MASPPLRRATAALLVLAVLAASSRGKAATKDPRLGCWKADGEKAVYLKFEEKRVQAFQEGHHSFYFARYGKDEVVLWAWTKRFAWKTSLDKGALSVDTGGGTGSFRRMDKDPPEIELKPHPLGKPAAVGADRVKRVQEELAKRREQDQAVRKDAARAREMGKVDAENTAWLKDLVKELGWIDAKRFGADSATAAFLLVQHSGDTPLMLAALPEIERDAKAKLVDGQDFALLYDRLHLNLGEKQRFGSQIASGPDGKDVVLPLEDRANVEKIRAALGLFPLSQYLEFFKAGNGGKEPAFLEWE
jgi:hypothetical protein